MAELKEDEFRGTGRTTRLVDSHIQELYKNGSVTVTDHHDNDIAHEHLANRIFQRLMRESSHNLRVYRKTARDIFLLKSDEVVSPFTKWECEANGLVFIYDNESEKNAENLKSLTEVNGPYRLIYRRGDVITEAELSKDTRIVSELTEDQKEK